MAKVSRRCGCRDDSGRQYGSNCPRLKDYRHGTWGFRLSAGFDPKTGKRRTITEYKYESAAEAEDALRAAEKALKGAVYDFTKRTVADYLRDWLDTQEKHSQLKPSTLRMYRTYVERDILNSFGEKLLLKNLHRPHVAQLVRDLQDAGRGATTIKRIHATLSSALSDAYQDGLVSDNAAAGARLPRIAKKRVQVWEPADAGKFLDAAAQHRLGALFELAVLTGMRRGELCGLRWQDVDLASRRLIVRVQVVQVGKKNIEGTVKTDAGQDRIVALSDRAVAALVTWQLAQGEERRAWGEIYQDSRRAFTYEDGRQLRPAYVSRIFEGIVSKAGLPKARFHDLRHLHASLMLASGQDLGIVSKTMGHSGSQITRDLYSHMVGDAARDAAEGAAALLPAREGVLTSVLTEQ